MLSRFHSSVFFLPLLKARVMRFSHIQFSGFDFLSFPRLEIPECTFSRNPVM